MTHAQSKKQLQTLSRERGPGTPLASAGVPGRPAADSLAAGAARGGGEQVAAPHKRTTHARKAYHDKYTLREKHYQTRRGVEKGYARNRCKNLSRDGDRPPCGQKTHCNAAAAAAAAGGGGGERVRGAQPRPCRPSATPWLGSRKKISTGRSTSRDAPSPADVAAIRPWASRDCGLGQVPLVCVAGGIAETVGVPAGRHADATTRWLGGAARGGRGGGGGWAAHVVDVGGEGQEVEEVREVLPHPSRPVHPQALVVESINLRGVKD